MVTAFKKWNMSTYVGDIKKTVNVPVNVPVDVPVNVPVNPI